MQRISRSQISAAQDSLKHLNAFVAVASAHADGKDGPLNDVHIAIKDNICTKSLPTTCASRGLRGYVSPYDATVVQRLQEAGGVIAGKTNLDEFGMGSHSIYSNSGSVKSVFGSRSAGGSSGGSAVAVASRQCHAALGTDTGGSVRLPAAYNGIYGFKPSYGRLSRWGVVAYANSLDTVGIMADDLPTLKTIFKLLDVYDQKDPTSIRPRTRARIEELVKSRPPKHGLRFGVPEQYRLDEMSPIVRQAWSKTLTFLQKVGHSIHTISLPKTEQALSAYYILAPAEASSNLAKYDGVRYGSRVAARSAQGDPLYAATRQQGFGEEVRRRILLGAYSLSANAIDNYFIQAQKIRRLVQDDFNQVFALPNAISEEGVPTEAADVRVDAIICPTAPDVPPTIEQVQNQSSLEAYAVDVLTVPASLAGLPALNVPIGIDEPPDSYDGPDSVGMQIITQFGDDDAALAIGKQMQPLRHLSSEGAHAAWLNAMLKNLLPEDRWVQEGGSQSPSV